jgi:hypothetical protein
MDNVWIRIRIGTKVSTDYLCICLERPEALERIESFPPLFSKADCHGNTPFLPFLFNPTHLRLQMLPRAVPEATLVDPVAHSWSLSFQTNPELLGIFRLRPLESFYLPHY